MSEEPTKRRLAAVVALVVGAATVALAVAVAISEFPRGLGLLGCVLVAGAARLVRRAPAGIARVAGLTVAGAGARRRRGAAVAGGGRSSTCWSSWGSWSRSLLRARRSPSTWSCRARRPRSDPVLFFNPRSGGGKAERFSLADEARARGIEPIELKPGDDLETLVRAAVERGADALAMAGGDGSQAIVAAIAAELGLPYACIPAGTRNHFALDLGVDRDDVVGALDAFVDGGERTRRPGRGQRARVRQQRLARALRRGRPARGLSRREAAHAARHGARRARPRSGGELDLRWTGPGGHEHRVGRRGAGLQQPLPARPRGRLGHAAADRRRPARDHRLRRALRARRERRVVAAPVARVVGARPSRSMPTAPSLPASTARRSCSTRRCGFAFGPESCACASRASTPAPRPRRWLPTASGPA